MSGTTVNRQYKSNLFAMIFSDRENALSLSDSFVPPAKDGVQPCIECVAHVLNINAGHNRELMESCRKLYEYSYLVDAVRSRLARGLKLSAAADEAVQECINSNILKEFLIKHRSEVCNVILMEYDQEQHIKSEKEVSYREGFSEGISQGISQGILKNKIQITCRKLKKLQSPEDIAEDLGEDLALILRICNVAQDYAPDYDCNQIYQLLQEQDAASAANSAAENPDNKQYL